MPHDVSWDEYNAHQAGRAPRPSLGQALDALGAQDGSGLIAVDLGCGEGVEVTALLDAGWTVHAVDGEPAALDRLAARTTGEPASRLHTVHVAFSVLPALPRCDLLHASYALPYCPPDAFEALWRRVREALLPGAVLSCQLFGPHDDSYGDREMTFHDADQVEHLLTGLELVHLREEDADGSAYTGPKHWHVFHLVARRPW